MQNGYKIILLICYYGAFPWYFEYFLHSCKFNPSITFLIFTDIPYEGPLPENVSLERKTLAEIATLASQKLGLSVCLNYPYKICDFKPALGYIFSEYTQEYDFWGQGDIDVIYGNIRNFMTDQVLSSFDYISIRHEYTTGCFSLYRNENRINHLFQRSRDIDTVFKSPDYLGFDEFNFKHHLITKGTPVSAIPTEIDTFTHIVKAADLSGEIRAHFDFLLLEGLPGKIEFKSGRLTYKQQLEAILYHLFWLKRIYYPNKYPRYIPDHFFVSPTRIYTKNKSCH